MLDLDPAVVVDPATPDVRQRARFRELLAGFDDAAWAAPSRCDGWSVQDVVTHLATATGFFALSIASGLDGNPTRFLEGFDPVATPAGMVAAVRDRPPAEALASLVEADAAMDAVLERVGGDDWEAVAEAPPGHLSVRAVVLHSLWDSWIHERDVRIPLGLPVVEEPDEVAAGLAYAVALGPGFLSLTGSDRPGTLEVVATDPEVRLVVEHGPAVRVSSGPVPEGTPRLTGRAVDLLEGLSFRAPFPDGLAPEDRWLLGALGEVFDQPV